MLNQYLPILNKYLHDSPCLVDPLTDTNTFFNPNQYLPLFNSYPDRNLNDSYKIVILKTGLA